MPTIYYIRHGETSWNAEGRLQGTRDIPLNELGRRQAAQAGRPQRVHERPVWRSGWNVQVVISIALRPPTVSGNVAGGTDRLGEAEGVDDAAVEAQVRHSASTAGPQAGRHGWATWVAHP
jgi:hypothetical protein